MNQVVDRFIDRLRDDPAFGSARALSRAHLEDHTLSLLAAIVHSLAAVEETSGISAELSHEGGSILDHIAFQRGAQRCRLGWSVAMVERECALLHDTVHAAACAQSPEPCSADSVTLDVLGRLLDRARAATMRGYRHGCRFTTS